MCQVSIVFSLICLGLVSCWKQFVQMSGQFYIELFIIKNVMRLIRAAVILFQVQMQLEAEKLPFKPDSP